MSKLGSEKRSIESKIDVKEDVYLTLTPKKGARKAQSLDGDGENDNDAKVKTKETMASSHSLKSDISSCLSSNEAVGKIVGTKAAQRISANLG